MKEHQRKVIEQALLDREVLAIQRGAAGDMVRADAREALRAFRADNAHLDVMTGQYEMLVQALNEYDSDVKDPKTRIDLDSLMLAVAVLTGNAPVMRSMKVDINDVRETMRQERVAKADATTFTMNLNIDMKKIEEAIERAKADVRKDSEAMFHTFIEERGLMLVPKAVNDAWLGALRFFMHMAGQHMSDKEIAAMVDIVLAAAPKQK